MTAARGGGSGDGGRRAARGRLGEEAALNLLERRGYRIVDTNVRFGSRSGLVGELDIVAWDGPTLCFVEVKARRAATVRGREEAVPAESVTPAKQRRIARLALAYIVRSELGDDTPVRFDVVSVILPPGDEGLIRRADLIQGAFFAPDDSGEA